MSEPAQGLSALRLFAFTFIGFLCLVSLGIGLAFVFSLISPPKPLPPPGTPKERKITKEEIAKRWKP